VKYPLLHITDDVISLKAGGGLSTGMLRILRAADGVTLVPCVSGHSIGIVGKIGDLIVELTFSRAKYIRLGEYRDDTGKAMLYVAVKQLIAMIVGAGLVPARNLGNGNGGQPQGIAPTKTNQRRKA
jgi:hypothetical protein